MDFDKAPERMWSAWRRFVAGPNYIKRAILNIDTARTFKLAGTSAGTASLFNEFEISIIARQWENPAPMAHKNRKLANFLRFVRYCCGLGLSRNTVRAEIYIASVAVVGSVNGLLGWHAQKFGFDRSRGGGDRRNLRSGPCDRLRVRGERCTRSAQRTAR